MSAIRPEDIYGGRRVTLLARLGAARIHLQVDVGLGDASVPEPEWLDYPSLLDLPRPHLRAYRPETVIAEKTQAMVQLGTNNSRMRDFFDVYMLAQRESFVLKCWWRRSVQPLSAAGPRFRTVFRRR